MSNMHSHTSFPVSVVFDGHPGRGYNQDPRAGKMCYVNFHDINYINIGNLQVYNYQLSV